MIALDRLPRWPVLVLAFTASVAACGDDDPEPTPSAPLTVDETVFAEGALGSIRAGATAEQRQTFMRGEQVAKRRFTPEEGLGPQFNVTFCVACHEKPVFGGGGPRYRDFYIFGQEFEDGVFVVGELGGVSHSYGLGADQPARPGRLPGYNVAAGRNPIPFFGVGALAEISESAILALADPDDLDGDGISGRPNYDQGFVGRFGRKSQTVSIEGFIRGPLNNHAGITSDPLTNAQKARLPIDSSVSEEELANRQRGQNLLTRGQPQAAAPASPLMDADGVPDPELAGEDLFDLVSWSMLLGAPKPDAATAQTELGESVFAEIGCAACHVPALASARGLIPAYSDILLHDMGESLADQIQAGLATGSEFRTQPLWGLAATGPYLHDGRADTVEEAILAHDGEGKASREAYAGRTAEERAAVLAFLDRLGGASQHSDGLIPPDAATPAAGQPGGPIAGLSADEQARFEAGRRLFDRNMPLTEGLGPQFNGDSCRACHFDPAVGGAGPLDVNAMRYGSWSGDAFEVPEGGTLLRKLAIIDRPRAESGPHQFFENRQTPTTLGLGAIESIPDPAILANADPDDLDGDGIRGVAHLLGDGRVGRFGWKGGVPSVREFVRDALSNEVGMTVPAEDGFSAGFLSDDDDVADPEIDSAGIDSIAFFIERLAPPAPRGDFPAGRAVFETIGCDGCHIPSLEGSNGPVPLYSDLLLHDIAPDGARGIPDGVATGRQFRTTPLWGIADTAPYMHDGHASTVEDAIAAHYGESTAAREAYEQLGAGDREALITFLENL